MDRWLAGTLIWHGISDGEAKLERRPSFSKVFQKVPKDGDRSEWREVKEFSGRSFAPKGLEHSAQGFNPGNRTSLRIALKGLQIEGVNSRIKRLSISRPFRARRSWWTIPRVETLG